nr:ComF family protein [Desulforhopalus vacuolatus]
MQRMLYGANRRGAALVAGAAEILLPRRCVVCGRPLLERGGQAVDLCDSCLERILPLRKPLCRICGREMPQGTGAGNLCGNCLHTRPSFTLCRSLFVYNETLRRIILKFKFQRRLEVLKVILELAGERVPEGFAECDFIVPVPLHKKRLQKRGYNQSLLLAQGFFGYDNDKIVVKLLERTKNTPPQSTLDRRKRAKNLRNMFCIRQPELLLNKRVCLVDDIYTTGATLEECSKTLVKSGACEVFSLTLGRTPLEKR